METFPFAGIGGLAAVAVLVAGYAVFAGLVRLIGAAAVGTMSVVPGILTGIRDWSRDAGSDARVSSPPAAPWVDLSPEMATEDQVGAE